MRKPDFIFVFDPPPDWTEEAFPSGVANSLAEAKATNPSLANLTLAQVWCNHSTNLMWASEGFFHDGPWVDP